MTHPDLRTYKQKLASAREAFLCLIADSINWAEDTDGDVDDEGRTVITVTYSADFRHSNLVELLEAFGIEVAYNETAGMALERELDRPL